MDPNDPILDQPQVIEFDRDPRSTLSRLANQDLYFTADANSDMYDLHWPWANERYVKSVRMAINEPRSEELITLVTRYYPGYQETILGSEGMIISKGQRCGRWNAKLRVIDSCGWILRSTGVSR